MRQQTIFFFILGVDVLILLLQIQNLSIASSEIYILEEQRNFLSFFYHFLFELFGRNDDSLRIPLLLLHLASVFLLYDLSKQYLTKARDRIWLLLLYVMLPGTLSAGIVLSHASFILFGLMLYLYLQTRVKEVYTYPLLLFFAVADGGFAYLFFGLLIFAFFQKNYRLLMVNILFLLLSAYLYRLQIYGAPSGHFLDTLAVYSAIFTPIVFVYLVYVLYRRYLAKKTDLLWYISTFTFIFTLLLSFRQRIAVEYFAPYLMIALPLGAQTFVHSYRVRLKQFRKGYKLIFVLSFIFLSLNTLVVVFNKYLYLYLDEPKKHFAYNMHVAKELAQQLQKKHIRCVSTDLDMQKRLHFYGIGKCSDVYLQKLSKSSNEKGDVTIRYKGVPVYKASVTKINKNGSK
ncbi:MAG: hypothetical protein FAF05_07090 [Epsilonproteobacteria bacterium]|nr:hypothetical protein [Campylobacterota bacterium]